MTLAMWLGGEFRNNNNISTIYSPFHRSFSCWNDIMDGSWRMDAGSCRKTFNEASVTSLKGTREITDFLRGISISTGSTVAVDVDGRAADDPIPVIRLKSPIVMSYY